MIHQKVKYTQFEFF